MQIDFLATFSFVFIASITPGPNNISSFSMSANHGYKKTLPYLLGIWLGSAMLFSLAGFLSGFLFQSFPVLKDVLKYVGSAYIVYLAYVTFFTNYDKENQRGTSLGFWNGVILQAVNPKALVFSTTLFSTLLASVAAEPLWLVPAGLSISLVTFICISIWAIFGGFIKRFMHNNWIRVSFNGFLAFALLYLAVRIAFFS